MPTFNYTNDIPFADHNPSTDQPDMLINTNSIDSIIAVDHYTFEEGNKDGYHKVIRQPTGSGTQNLTRSGAGAVYANVPSNIANINQILSGQYTPDTTGGTLDTQLFSLTSSNVLSQLTGSKLTNTATSDGWVWIGGILIQWGFVSTSSSGTTSTITFKDRIPGAIPFPNNIFFAGATLFSTNATTPPELTGSGISVLNTTISITGFQVCFSSAGGGKGRGFYWLAIGN